VLPLERTLRVPDPPVRFGPGACPTAADPGGVLRIVFFVHSIVSDWSHGNAHFLRGLARALGGRGHSVATCERWKAWSVEQLFHDHGHGPLIEFARLFPDLDVRIYGGWESVIEDVETLTRAADLVVVHEFNDPQLVGAVGQVRRRRDDFVLLFHDTHHRAVSAPAEIAAMNLAYYDGILAYGESLARVYRETLGHSRVWTFHEAADTTLFHPRVAEKRDDVVWIGNWGDGERTDPLRAYLVESARSLPELRFAVHGVRYPEDGRREMESAGIEFRGWLANYHVPDAFARSKMTLHIPRGPYVAELPGIPTIRPFEAMACGVPLISTPWIDAERLFTPGADYLVARTPAEMRNLILTLARDDDARARLAEHGLRTIRERHTCGHRAVELETIYDRISRAGAEVG
jgi:spore maturation protein CgeB